MPESIPVVTVAAPGGGTMIINQSDFNPAVHQLPTPKKAVPTEKKAVPTAKKAEPTAKKASVKRPSRSKKAVAVETPAESEQPKELDEPELKHKLTTRSQKSKLSSKASPKKSKPLTVTKTAVG